MDTSAENVKRVLQSYHFKTHNFHIDNLKAFTFQLLLLYQFHYSKYHNLMIKMPNI